MLNQSKLLNEVCRIQEEGGTGSLRLEKGEREITVYFDQGLINAASTNIAQLKLGQILSRRGHTDDAGICRLLESSRRRNITLGKVAVAIKLLDGAELQSVVQEQVVQLLLHALDNDFEIQSFNGSLTSFFMPARLDMDRLLLELARNHVKPYKLEPGQLISLTNGKGHSDLPWYPQELTVLGELKSPRTFHNLAVATGLEYRRLSKILSVFDSMHLITVQKAAAEETTAIVIRDRPSFEQLIPEIGKAGLSDKIETIQDDSSFVSEQFKTLKVRINEVASGKPMHVITVSSPHTEDGKSLICANLAASCAKDPGRRTIIVDCDLRKPSLHKLLGASLEPGLLGYLEGDYLQPYCYMRRHEKLYIMTAGGVAANPVEILSLGRMKGLIDYLKLEFDTIILDSPPFAPISDAQILTSLSDGLLLVVRRGRTSYGALEKAFRTMDQSKLIGAVFNDVQPVMFNTQYDHKYYHYRYRQQYPYGKKPLSVRPKNYLEK
jgi:protein-tyrosine kinase